MHVARDISGRAVRTRRFMFHWPMSAGFSRMLAARSSPNFERPVILFTISELKIRSGTNMFFARMELAEF